MKALTPAPLTYDAGLPVYLATPSCRENRYDDKERYRAKSQERISLEKALAQIPIRLPVVSARLSEHTHHQAQRSPSINKIANSKLEIRNSKQI